MFGLGAIPAMIQLLLSSTLPESPRFDILHGNFHRARQTLAVIYPDSNAHSLDARVTSLRDQITKERHEGASIRDASTIQLLRKLWKDDGNRRALTVACGLQLFQQLTGFNTLIYYSGRILQAVHFAKPATFSIAIASANLCVFFGVDIAYR